MARFHNPTLLFSGGKDSLATLLRLQPYWSTLNVVWTNSGAAHPKTVEYMRGIAQRVPHFQILHGAQPQWIERHGWPADVVPVQSMPVMHGAEPRPIRFMPRTACCTHNLWLPVHRYILDTGCTLVITGQRGDEPLRNRARDAATSVIDGVTYWSPLHDWSHEQVMRYLQEQGEPLPPFYGEGVEHSIDCWNCTAYLDHNVKWFERMRTTEPDRWEAVRPILEDLDRRIRDDSEALRVVIGN